MKSLSEILAILKREKSYLKDRYKLSNIAVFGSVSRGEANETSDVDLLVELEQPLGLEFVQLSEDLESILGEKVDVADREMLQKLWPYVSPELVYA
jgi:predicted nucleotidyltransferase